MANFNGTVGNDNLTGSINNDIFNLNLGGSDTVKGLAGEDIFTFGVSFRSTDFVSGGGGLDILSLNGNYADTLLINSTMLNTVEYIYMAAGNEYNLSLFDGVIGNGRSLTFDGTSLGAGDRLSVDTGSHTIASLGTKAVVLGGVVDTFVISGFGNLTLKGGSGQDAVNFGTDFNSGDSLDGGSDKANYIHLNGEYSAGLTVSGAMLKNFQTIYLDPGSNYKLTLKDGVVAAGQSLAIQGGGLGAANIIDFDGSQETNGNFTIFDGAGNDFAKGGALRDVFFSDSGGIDTFFGLGGDDFFQMGSTLTKDDRIDGGTGFDDLGLRYGTYVFDAQNVKNIEAVTVNADGGDFRIVTNDATVASGQTMGFYASQLSSSFRFVFNGSAELDGNFSVIGGAGKDVLKGGAGNDVLYGFGGSDVLTGGAGSDTFGYLVASHSQVANRDVIRDFDAATDRFEFEGDLFMLSTVDTAVSGKLNAATFNVNLTQALNAAHLGVHHVVIFTATSGDLAGSAFLVGDANGIAGYQAADDLIVEITGATNLASFDIDNII